MNQNQLNTTCLLCLTCATGSISCFLRASQNKLRDKQASKLNQTNTLRTQVRGANDTLMCSKALLSDHRLKLKSLVGLISNNPVLATLTRDRVFVAHILNLTTHLSWPINKQYTSTTQVFGRLSEFSKIFAFIDVIHKWMPIIILLSLCKLAYQASLSCAKLKRILAPR